MQYGDVAPFAEVKNDKEQALKPLEEAAEVFRGMAEAEKRMQRRLQGMPAKVHKSRPINR